MPLKDLLKRHKAEGQADVQDAPSTSSSSAPQYAAPQEQDLDVPEFTFMRTTTSTQEIISPPSYPGDARTQIGAGVGAGVDLNKSPKRLSRFRRGSNTSERGGGGEGAGEVRTSREEKRLSERFHLSGHRSRSHSAASSVNLPKDLPDVSTMSVGGEEENWEKRATLLARGNPNQKDGGGIVATGGGSAGSSRPTTPLHRRTPSQQEITRTDDDIQAAITLHESGDLKSSTEMFGRLADPDGANNPLSQVLYGLALRHGWGIPKDEGRAITYLSQAASNSAGIEEEALRAGVTKGGAAKGELTLAIFELANCFRNGW